MALQEKTYPFTDLSMRVCTHTHTHTHNTYTNTHATTQTHLFKSHFIQFFALFQHLAGELSILLSAQVFHSTTTILGQAFSQTEHLTRLVRLQLVLQVVQFLLVSGHQLRKEWQRSHFSHAVQDPDTQKVKKNAIYYDKPQHASFGGKPPKPLFQSANQSVNVLLIILK